MDKFFTSRLPQKDHPPPPVLTAEMARQFTCTHWPGKILCSWPRRAFPAACCPISRAVCSRMQEILLSCLSLRVCVSEPGDDLVVDVLASSCMLVAVIKSSMLICQRKKFFFIMHGHSETKTHPWPSSIAMLLVLNSSLSFKKMINTETLTLIRTSICPFNNERYKRKEARQD